MRIKGRKYISLVLMLMFLVSFFPGYALAGEPGEQVVPEVQEMVEPSPPVGEPESAAEGSPNEGLGEGEPGQPLEPPVNNEPNDPAEGNSEQDPEPGEPEVSENPDQLDGPQEITAPELYFPPAPMMKSLALMKTRSSGETFPEDEYGNIGDPENQIPGYLSLNKKAEQIVGTNNQWKVTLSITGVPKTETTDIVLVIDRSGSMANDGRMNAAKIAARSFINTLLPDDNISTRIALVSFATDVTVHANFTENRDTLLDYLDGGNDSGTIRPSGGTFTQAALRQAETLANSNSSTADKKVIVLLSDGEPTYSYAINNPENHLTYWKSQKDWPTTYDYYRTREDVPQNAFNYNNTVGNGQDSDTRFKRSRINHYKYYYNHGNSAISESKFSKALGRSIYTVALSAGDEGNRVLNGIASENQAYTASPADLNEIFNNIASSIAPAATDATITDPMGQYFSIPGIDETNYDSLITVSEGTIGYDAEDETITWHLDAISSDPYTMTYTVEIDADAPNGNHETNGETPINYTNINGNAAEKQFSIPKVPYTKAEGPDITVLDKTVPYDGQGHGPNDPTGLEDGDEVWYKDGENWTKDKPVFTEVNRDAGGDVIPYEVEAKVTNTKYADRDASSKVTITPVSATITVANASKVFGTADPGFTGTVSGLIGTDSLGTVSYSRSNDAEEVGIYEDVLTAAYEENSNYTVTVVPGDFEITSAIGADLVITSYSDVYDAEAHSITVTNTIEGDTVYYSLTNNGSDWSTTLPTFTDVTAETTVYVKVTNDNYNDRTGSGTVTITPAAATITVANASKVFGTADPGFTGTVSGLIGTDSLGTVSYSRSNDAEEVGIYEDVLTAAYEENSNYTVTVVPGDFEITSAIGADLVITSYSDVYDAEAHSITVTNTIEGDTVYYSLTNNGSDWSTTLPTFTDVTAETTVYVKVTNDNYNDRTGSGTVTITPAAATITVANASKVFGTADPGFTGTVSGLIGTDSLGTVSYSRSNDAEEVGIYEDVLTAAYEENSNYTVTVVPGDFEITSAIGADLVITSYSDVYDAEAHSITVTNTIEGDTVYYSLTNNGSDWSTTLPTFTDVTAETTVYVKVTNDNYNDRTGSGTVTITPAAATITVANASKVFGTADPGFTGTVSGLIGTDSLGTVSYSRSNDAEEVGIYEDVLTAAYEENSNYTVTVVPGDFEITSAIGADLVITSYSDVYDAEAHSITVTNTIEGDTVYYSLTNNGSDWSTTLPTFTDVTAETTVYVKVTNDNYNDRTGSGTVIITPAAATITVANASKVFGTADPGFTGTVSGLIGTDSLGTVSYSRSNDAEEVGIYEDVLTAAYEENSNYTVTVVPGDFEITSAIGADLVITSYSDVYDAEAHSITVTNTIEGDTVYYSLTNNGSDWSTTLPTFTDVTAETTVYVKVTNDNYNDRTGSGTVIITPAAATITVANASKVFGTADPGFTGTVSGLIGTDSLGTVSYSRSKDAEEVGIYEDVLTAAYEENSNYTVTVVPGDFEITSAIGADLVITSYSDVYDAEAHSITVTNTIEGDTVYYSLTNNGSDWSTTLPTFTDVTAETTVYVKVTNDNYNDRTGSGTVIITPAAATITVANASKVFGTADPGFTGTVSGLIGTDSLGTVSYSRSNDAEEVGIYEDVLTAAYEENSNYTVTVVPGDFEITSAIGADLVITSYSDVYDAEAHSITVTNTIEGDTVYYSLTNNGSDWSTTLPTFTDVTAETTVYVKVTNDNYNDRTGSGTVTITPAAVTITADSASKKYNGNPLTASGWKLSDETPLVEGHVITSVTVTGSQTAVGTSNNVPSAAIIMDGEVDVTTNYAVTYVNGTLTVTSGGGSSGPSGPSGPSGGTTPEEPIEVPEEPEVAIPLNKDDHFAYVVGYPDNTVQPLGKITREEVAAVFYRLLEDEYRETIKTDSSDFPDVGLDRWSSKHIGTLASVDIIIGYPDGNFQPGNTITRAELATIASKFDNLSPFEDNSFSDIEGHWANKYINSAAQKGWVSGYPDGTFKPDQAITRAEFVTLVNKVLERKVLKEDILPDAKQFPDLSPNAWYYVEVQEAVNSHHYERATRQDYEIWTDIYYPELDM